MGLRRTPQNANNGVTPGQFTDLPRELREMIWRRVLNLNPDDIAQGRTVEIAVDRQITRNLAQRRAQGNRTLAPIDVFFRYINTRATREVQNPLEIALLSHQTLLDVRSIWEQTTAYRSELRYLTPYDRRGVSQREEEPGAAQPRIYFHPRLDTVYMNPMAMMHYTTDFWDVFRQANFTDPEDGLTPLEPIIHGLEEVLHVAFRTAVIDPEERPVQRRILNVLAQFIPADQIPVLPDNEQGDGDFDEDEIEIQQSAGVHFENATVTFLEPSVPERTFSQQFDILDTEIRELYLMQAPPNWGGERAWGNVVTQYLHQQMLPAFRRIIRELFLNDP